MNLIVTSAGRRNELIECFRRDAIELGLALRVLAADMQPNLSAACQLADESFKVPRCNSPDYISALLQLCVENRVTLLVPTIDTELAVLSQNVAQFAAVGTRVVVSRPEVVALAGDKFQTAQVLQAAGIPTPKTMLLADYCTDPASMPFPIIAKPIAGSASIGIIRPKSRAEIADLPPDGYIVQELWLGREFTVNMFLDQSGTFRCGVPHERLEVRAGEVSKGCTRRMSMLEEAARRLANILPGATGPLCFQAIVKESGEFVVFEINARFGGGFPLAHRAGAPFTKWLLEEALGRRASASNEWLPGITMLRFDSSVFLDE